MSIAPRCPFHRLLPAVVLAGLVVFAAASVLPTLAAESLSYGDLVDRLTDLEHVAVLPAEGETCRQWSSWDRSSRYDEAAGKYVNWQANNDGPNFIRQEGEQFVLAEMEGPGCIWRIWSARAEGGHVGIFLDGADEPAVDLPFEKYFSGDTAPFDYPMLSYNLIDLGCRGQNLYFPIPYQKSCKIVADAGWGRYYQFVYTTFPKGSEVPTFSAALAAEHASSLEALDGFLRGRQGSDPAGRREGQKTERGSVAVPAGETVALAELTGARAITAFRGSIELGDREDEMAALRKLCLRITFDGQPQPAVWCPIGDFCGTAPGVNPYRSLVTGMKIVHAPLDRPFKGLGHFHCKWHRDVHELAEDRWPDWVMLRTEGRGRFCGVMLHVWDPRPGWWGEGDEKFFVDGEKYPSTFGTGSEDYFGYAWCHPGLFERPLHGQTMTEQNQGHQSVFRWQIADNVPFQESFEACIEKYHRTEEWGTKYAATVCWYLAPGGADPYEPVPVDQRLGYYDRPPLAAGGFKILGQPAGNVRTQGMDRYEDTWKDGDQLWWTGASPGDVLEVVLPVEKSGTYRLSVVLTKARDYGVVQLAIDGKPAGEPIDLYNATVVRTEPIPLGTFRLDEGEHVLAVRIVGANEQAVKSYMFGLDEVQLENAE